MLLILTLIISVASRDVVTSADKSLYAGYLQCSENEFCQNNYQPYSEPYSNQYSERGNDYRRMRQAAENLRKIVSKNIIGVRVNDTIIKIEEIEMQKQLCSMQTIGFLLDENVENYTVACVWAGDLLFGDCTPVPLEYKKDPFYYIDQQEWKKKLEYVHKAIGCYSHDGGYQKVELFICNERCIQAGIGYLASILMIIIIFSSLVRNCSRQE